MSNKKDSYYFSHDYNARNDEKIKRLIRKHDYLGYGLWWAIVEDLYNNANALQIDYEGIAYDLHTNPDIIKSIINDFDLFVIDGDTFGSLSVERRLNERYKKSVSARESAEKRWERYRKDANALQTHSESNAIKEKKGKEIKEKKVYIPTLGIEVVKQYSDLTEEFKSMYSEDFYKSWLNINRYLDENCEYLRTWDNQIKIKEYKQLFDKVYKGELTLQTIKDALEDLNGSRVAKERYNSVYHGLNVFIKTIKSKK